MVVDASVAVKWFLDEDRSDAARELLDAPYLLAPGAIRLEVAHVLWKSARRGVTTLEAAQSGSDVMERLFATAPSTDTLIAPAIRLMANLRHPVYDCLYLALAEREGLPLVTADERQFAAARTARIDARLL